MEWASRLEALLEIAHTARSALYRVYKLTHASCFVFIIKMPATDAAVADSRSGLWFNGLNINRLSESQPALLQINPRWTTEAHVQNNFLLVFKAFCGGICDESEKPTNRLTLSLPENLYYHQWSQKES